MNLAGLIDGGYTGSGAGADPFIQSNIGVNSPTGKRAKSGYNIIYTAADSANLPVGNQIRLGGFAVDRMADDALLTPAEAFAIDRKTDDGSPDKGKTRGRYYYYSGSWLTDKCITGGATVATPVYPNRTYITTRTGMECILYFDIQS